LDEERHERFAQGLALGLTAVASYTAAGFKADRGHASRLAANGSIRARVRHLQRRAADKVVVNLETMTQQLMADRAYAILVGQASACVKATMGIAELNGLTKKEPEDAGAMAGLLKGATIVNGQYVLNRIEIVVVDPAKPVVDRGEGAGSKGVHAPAPTRAVQGR
jgi:hypothetical protein